MKRRVRHVIETAVPIVGMAVIFGSVLFGSPNNLQLQVIMLLVGVLLLEAGVWGLVGGVLPSERRHPELREEGDHFLDLVRQLSAAAVARDDGTEDDASYREALAAMHSSVDRMGQLAGKPGLSEPPTEASPAEA